MPYFSKLGKTDIRNEIGGLENSRNDTSVLFHIVIEVCELSEFHSGRKSMMYAFLNVRFRRRGNRRSRKFHGREGTMAEKRLRKKFDPMFIPQRSKIMQSLKKLLFSL